MRGLYRSPGDLMNVARWGMPNPLAVAMHAPRGEAAGPDLTRAGLAALDLSHLQAQKEPETVAMSSWLICVGTNCAP